MSLSSLLCAFSRGSTFTRIRTKTDKREQEDQVDKQPEDLERTTHWNTNTPTPKCAEKLCRFLLPRLTSSPGGMWSLCTLHPAHIRTPAPSSGELWRSGPLLIAVYLWVHHGLRLLDGGAAVWALDASERSRHSACQEQRAPTQTLLQRWEVLMSPTAAACPVGLLYFYTSNSGAKVPRDRY